MEIGVQVDHTYAGYAQPEWTGGEPRNSFWLGLRVKGDRMPVVTYRCKKCGYLESYARPEDEE
jgi:hypothetical protein